MNHTLVIPTYNRPELVRRLVGYYLRHGTSMRMLVLDSSKADTAAANAAWFTACGPAVRHVVFPDTLQPGAKLAQGLLLVETPYASFCADDDLVFPQGLADAIRFLGENPDYVCAHGLYLNFQVHEGRHDLNIWREYGGPDNEAGHPGARIYRLFQNYESLFYAVFRSADLRDVFAGVPGIPSLHFQELFQSVATLIKGKVKRFPRLYAARQSCTPAQPERDNWQTYYWFAGNSTELLDHYRVYCDDLWRFYETHGQAPRLDRAAFRKTLDLAHAVYFSAGCPPEYFHSVLQQYWPDDRFAASARIDLDQLILKYHASGRIQQSPIDLFDQLRSTDAADSGKNGGAPSKFNFHYLLAATLLALQAARFAPSRLSLDWRARRLGATPWRCSLPWDLCWLAGQPEFRSTYLELCRYLDGR